MILTLMCVDMAHAGYFVASKDEKNVSEIKDLHIKSVRRYKHIKWSYIDVPPQSERKLKTAAAERKIRLIPDPIVKLTQTPSDPLADLQTTIYPGYSNANIYAAAAWDILTTASVTVAIIDSGIQTNHEDLVANIWNNDAEINGTAGMDDDANGFIDDLYGWNTHSDNNNVEDTLGHGTHVAGIIGARGQNGIGIAGICWDVKLMPLRSFEGTTTSISLIVDAFDYILSTNANVKIINCSFGDDIYVQPFYDAVDAARRQGILVVAAAGNSAHNIDQIPFYPASYNLANVIAVGAIDIDGQLWSGSNYGNTVGVVAPGVAIESTMSSNVYGVGTGTSYAAPIVSGAAALIMTQWPNMTVEDVKRQVVQTTRITNALATETLGGGLLDMRAMLTSYISAADDWQLYE